MIKENLLKYKEITEDIINNIKKDLDLNNLMEKRQNILKTLLEDSKINNEEIKSIYLELNLDKLNKSLKEEINKEMERNNEELKAIKNQRNANIAYGKNINTINIFSKKI